jgi:integrase
MATLTVDKPGKTAGYNIQWYEDKRRFTIYLGGRRYTKKTAERLKEIVEMLLYYKRNGITVSDKSVELWLKSVSDEIRSKLAKAGLLTLTEAKTCQQLWDTFLKSKTDIKGSTLAAYNLCQMLFFRTFSPEESIEKITSDRLQEWKASLLEEYAEASVAGYVKNLKAVLNWAVDKQKWLTENPIDGVSRGSFVNRDNDRIISMEEYAQLLDACPNQEWRTIIALARIGGLRCSSELKQLRWSDINWEQNRFLVRSPKTERHEKHRERIVPLFAELRTELDRHFLLDETVGNEFVIQSYQGTSWGLNDPFQRIACNAGLGTILRPFDNMRMSRSNEVLSAWGEAKESLWIGHSVQVMKNHYLCVSDDDFAKAAGVGLAGSNIHAVFHAAR